MTEGNLIVNCKVANLRPKYANLRKWIENSCNILINVGFRQKPLYLQTLIKLENMEITMP